MIIKRGNPKTDYDDLGKVGHWSKIASIAQHESSITKEDNISWNKVKQK